MKEINFKAFREGRVRGMALMRGKRMILPPYYPQRNDGRYLGHIATDKPFYKPNDVVFIETWIVDSLNKTPRFIAEPKPTSGGRRPYISKIWAKATILDSFDKKVFSTSNR